MKYGMIHKSAEGGNDTIAFGHKLTDKEIKNNKVYGYNLNELTAKNAKHIIIRFTKSRNNYKQIMEKNMV